MPIFLLAGLTGIVTGMRTMLGITALSWAARMGWLHLHDTKLAFLGYAATPWVLSLMAVGELVGDKLPMTPSRKMPFPFAARVIMGGVAGTVIGVHGGTVVTGLVAGVIGSVVGTLSGAKFRGMLAKAFKKDFPAACLEDLIAIGLVSTVVNFLR